MDFNIKVNEQEVNTVLTALASQPFKDVAELINKVHTQANEQVKNEQERATLPTEKQEVR